MKRKPIIFKEIMDQEIAKTLLPEGNGALALRNRFNSSKRRNNASISVEALMCLCRDDELRGYDQNRGSGKCSKSILKEVSEKFEPCAIGEILIGVFPEQLIIADGHGRTSGLVDRLNKGRLTKKDLETQVNIKLLDDKEEFLIAYQKSNTCQKHSSGQCLSNQDLGFGSVMKKVFDGLPYEIAQMYDKASTITMLCYILYGYHCQNTNGLKIRSFHDVYGLRNTVTKLGHLLPEELNLNIKNYQIKNLQDAMVYWSEYQQHITKMCTKDVRKIFRAQGWMGTILVDKASNIHLFHKRVIDLAKASSSKAFQVSRALPNITRCRKDDIHYVLVDINDVLRGNKSKITQF